MALFAETEYREGFETAMVSGGILAVLLPSASGLKLALAALSVGFAVLTVTGHGSP